MTRLELRLPPVVLAAPDARRALAAWLLTLGFDSERLFAPLLVVTELVTNGVIHNGGDDIVVAAEVDGPSLRIEVVTKAGAPDADIRARLKIDAEETGRGLTIVEALCDEIDIADDPSGRRTVTCTMTLKMESPAGGV